MRVKRGYNRDTPAKLVKDYKLFAIACEGSKREPEYFRLFKYLSNKIKVDVIEEKVTDEDLKHTFPTKSAPKWVLQRAINYIEQEGLIDEDDLWFVMDVDRWEWDQLKEIADYCKDYPNWNFVLSNPCFEVWLYFHKKSDISISESKNCSDFKHEISTFEPEGYDVLNYISYLNEAIENAKITDSDPEHFMPNSNETKVYLLGEAILEIVGKNGFENFISSVLPKLRNGEL